MNMKLLSSALLAFHVAQGWAQTNDLKLPETPAAAPGERSGPALAPATPPGQRATAGAAAEAPPLKPALDPGPSSRQRAGAPEAPAPNLAPDTDPGPDNCPGCTDQEQLVVNLNYYRQMLTLLGDIDKQKKTIAPELLKTIHGELRKSAAPLATIMAPPPPAPAPAPRVTPKKAPAKATGPTVKKKPTPPRVRKTGIDGLTLAHVDEGDPKRDIGGSVVLISHQRPYSLALDGTLRHNNQDYRIVDILYLEDPLRGNQHQVIIENRKTKKRHVVPWN